jgi:hypothetical protein
MSSDPAPDRFGITEEEILAVIRKHAGLIRSGCYVPTRAEVAAKEPEWLYSVLVDWWWESPTELIPTDEQVNEVVQILRSRSDAQSDAIQKIISEAP